MTKVFIFFTFSFYFFLFCLYGHLTEHVVNEHWTRTSPAPPPQRTCAAVMPGQHPSWLLPASTSGRPARVYGPRRGSGRSPEVDADMARAWTCRRSACGPAWHGQQGEAPQIPTSLSMAARRERRDEAGTQREQRLNKSHCRQLLFPAARGGYFFFFLRKGDALLINKQHYSTSRAWGIASKHATHTALLGQPTERRQFSIYLFWFFFFSVFYAAHYFF